jgi:hypothetical protein
VAQSSSPVTGAVYVAVMIIGTWNVAYGRGPYVNPRRVKEMAIHQADVWVLTETHASLSPGDDYTAFPSLPRPEGPLKVDSGSSWVTIWVHKKHRAEERIGDEHTRATACMVEIEGRSILVYGTVGCPLKAGTVATAQTKGLLIIANPPDKVKDGEPLPEICLQQTVTVRPPEPIRKLYQRFYWLSDTWQKMYRRRTYVEGSYGNRKNVSTENLRRGLFQSMGLPWANFVVSLVAASYNARMIMNWHDRTGLGNSTNPLFVKALGTMDWKEMTSEERANEIALYEEALGIALEGEEAA